MNSYHSRTKVNDCKGCVFLGTSAALTAPRIGHITGFITIPILGLGRGFMQDYI